MTKTFTKNENYSIPNKDILRLSREIELEYLEIKPLLDRFNFEPSTNSVKRILDFSKALN